MPSSRWSYCDAACGQQLPAHSNTDTLRGVLMANNRRESNDREARQRGGNETTVTCDALFSREQPQLPSPCTGETQRLHGYFKISPSGVKQRTEVDAFCSWPLQDFFSPSSDLLKWRHPSKETTTISQALWEIPTAVWAVQACRTRAFSWAHRLC